MFFLLPELQCSHTIIALPAVLAAYLYLKYFRFPASCISALHCTYVVLDLSPESRSIACTATNVSCVLWQQQQLAGAILLLVCMYASALVLLHVSSVVSVDAV